MTTHNETDKSVEKAETTDAGDRQPNSAADEAGKSAIDLIKQQRQEMKYQKDPERPPMTTSMHIGRPEIVGDDGKPLVKGMTAVKEDAGTYSEVSAKPSDAPTAQPTGSDSASKPSSHPPLEERSKVKERIPANSVPGHPFDEVIYEDGTKRQLRPGGTIVEIRDNMTITARPDHSLAITENGQTREVKPTHPERGVSNTKVGPTGIVLYTYDNNTTEMVMEDGLRIVTNGDGTETWHNPDGSTSHGDGQNTKYYDAKGNLTGQTVFNQSDNSIVHFDKDGRVEKTVSDAVSDKTRTREFKYDDKGLSEINGHLGTWNRMEGPDGKTYWQNREKPEMQWHGEMLVDKDGNLHYKPHDPQAQAWTFTRDGRDVKAPSRK